MFVITLRQVKGIKTHLFKWFIGFWKRQKQIGSILKKERKINISFLKNEKILSFPLFCLKVLTSILFEIFAIFCVCMYGRLLFRLPYKV